VSALLILPSMVCAQEEDANSLVYPRDSQPFGMTYGDWQVAYWQYIFGIPASVSPVLDTTGQYCHLAQSSGPLFFLNSAFLGSSVTRTCTVSASKVLLVPLAAWECSSVEAPPSYGENPQDMRTCAAIAMDGFGLNTLKLSVDGKDLSGLARNMRVQTPYYQFSMPATDNLLGLDGVTSGSSVSDAYLVILKPLSPGKHRIHFEGTFVSGPAAGGSFAVTYHLAVQ
jgi:hypothetical protein